MTKRGVEDDPASDASELAEELGDADVESGDVIMIEAKEDSDSKWPRDKIQTYLENFRDFEINTRVDALDNQVRYELSLKNLSQSIEFREHRRQRDGV